MFRIADILPHEWTPTSVDYGDDASVMMRIYYIGAQASGIIDIASTGDITFKHGASGSEAADSDTALDDGGAGIIDVSADVTDYLSLARRINSSNNWRCKLIGALPTDDMHTNSTGHFTEVTGGDCKAANGYAVKTDDGDSLYICAGLTFGGAPTKTHNTDHQVYHEINQIIAKSTYGSGSSALYVYECDDDDDTATLILTLTAGATTVEVGYPSTTTYQVTPPLAYTTGKRLVVKLINSAALGTVRLKVVGRSYAFGPSVRDDKLPCELAQ